MKIKIDYSVYWNGELELDTDDIIFDSRYTSWEEIPDEEKTYVIKNYILYREDWDNIDLELDEIDFYVE